MFNIQQAKYEKLIKIGEPSLSEPEEKEKPERYIDESRKPEDYDYCACGNVLYSDLEMESGICEDCK